MFWYVLRLFLSSRRWVPPFAASFRPGVRAPGPVHFHDCRRVRSL